MSTILDTDYMLIQRGIESFKVTCEDVKDHCVTAPVLDWCCHRTAALMPTVLLSFTSTPINCGDAATLEMTGTVTGVLGIKAGSDQSPLMLIQA